MWRERRGWQNPTCRARGTSVDAGVAQISHAMRRGPRSLRCVLTGVRYNPDVACVRVSFPTRTSMRAQIRFRSSILRPLVLGFRLSRRQFIRLHFVHFGVLDVIAPEIFLVYRRHQGPDRTDRAGASSASWSRTWRRTCWCWSTARHATLYSHKLISNPLIYIAEIGLVHHLRRPRLEGGDGDDQEQAGPAVQLRHEEVGGRHEPQDAVVHVDDRDGADDPAVHHHPPDALQVRDATTRRRRPATGIWRSSCWRRSSRRSGWRGTCWSWC